MEKMQEFLADKKERASKRSPKYGMRKLSIGFVSCFLGCMIFMAPGQIHAQVETNKEPVAIAMEEKVSKEAEAPKAEAPVEEKAQAAPAPVETSLAGEEVQEGPKAEAVDEPAIVNPEEGPRTEVVEEKTQDAPTPVEANVEGEEAPKAEAVDTSDTVNLEEAPAAEENVVALELAKLADPEAQKAGETTEKTKEAKDISNNIINPRVSIRTENTTTPGTLDAGLGEQLTWGVSFTTPEGTKEGDTFTVKLSDNMSLKGLEPDTDYALPVKFGDKIIANAKRIDRQTIQLYFYKRYRRFEICQSLHYKLSSRKQRCCTKFWKSNFQN